MLRYLLHFFCFFFYRKLLLNIYSPGLCVHDFTIAQSENRVHLHLVRETLFMLLQSSQLFLALPSSTQPIPHFHSHSPHCCPRPWVLHISSLTNPFTFFQTISTLPSSPLTGVSLFISWFYISGCILLMSVFCSFHSSYKWDHMVFVFPDYLILLSIIVSSSLHALMKGKNLFSLSLHIFHCINVSEFLNLLINWWA